MSVESESKRLRAASKSKGAPCAAPSELEQLRAAVKTLTRENKRLSRELTEMEDRAEVAENECDELREVAELVEGTRADALAHARTVLQGLDVADSFTRTMNERAADAITELIGR